MKNCKCGRMLASTALGCPCGERFTHPFVKAVTWMIGGILGLSVIIGIFSSSEDHTAKLAPVTIPGVQPTIPVVQPTIPVVQPTNDEATFVIQHCGKPDSEFIQNAPATIIRHLVYKRFNTELLFYRGADMAEWGLGNAFFANRDEDMTMEEANRRMPCAKGN